MKRTIYVCLAAFCVLLLPGITAAQSGEPIMENSAVQASRLIERIEPVYPETARQAGIKGFAMLTVTVDEKGRVSAAQVLSGHHSLVPAAIEAVQKWRYTPAMSGGKAIPVRTLLSIPFGVPPRIELMINADGRIVGPSIEDAKDLEIAVSTDPQISYAALDNALRELQSRGASRLNVISPSYVFKAGQLFYQPGSFLSRIGGNVRPPELGIDLNALAPKPGTDSTEMSIIRTPFGDIVRGGLRYLVCINAAGEIVFVERSSPSSAGDLAEVESALRQAPVKSPAYLDGKPVPAAIMVSIPQQ